MCFESDSNAALAAAQAAINQKQQAFEEALNFQKQQFQEAKTAREPFLRYNGNAIDQWAGLLGILPNFTTGDGFTGFHSGTEGNGTIAALAKAAGTAGGTSGGSGNRPGTAGTTTTSTTNTSPFDGVKFPGGYPTYQVGDVGKEHPVPGDQPILPNPGNVPNPNPIRWIIPGTSVTWPPKY